ncbi:HNH endonuclease [Paenisporosarcina cavernae]|uniref:HNH endonuclease n=1 Tax=Paenisporosarcina cavernae TaxID=2320858 RepID=A0A385YRX3_9BACL|nr:HNH endonuclease signature motif containing protein [Paenisporosarcina cavernae]AYC28472.1 HNH endonuclease [Paenisporosarcina cavernae]
MGWDLTAAESKDDYLTENDLWRHTQHFLMDASHTTSYKHVLMKALLESIAEITNSCELSFVQISRHVTKIYWNLVVTNNIRQLNSNSTISSVEKILYSFQEKYSIPSEWNFDQLIDKQQEELIKHINKVYKQYVFGSFYKSFNGSIFSFNKNEEWVRLNPPYVIFFERYKRILMNATNYQLALFLEKHNSHSVMTNLLRKLEFLSARQSLQEFKFLLQKQGTETCFYCHQGLVKSHVDHFIPWSYMQNDVLWNFVLACPRCNTSKGNKLADNNFLSRLIDRNNQWQDLMVTSNYSEEKLHRLYHFAESNGFATDWRPVN